MTRMYKGCGWPMYHVLECTYTGACYVIDVDACTSFSGSI